MDTFRTTDATLEIDHHSGVIHVTVTASEGSAAFTLSVVEASQLNALLHKHINEAAVEKLRTRNQ
jgi:hypothetical protein